MKNCKSCKHWNDKDKNQQGMFNKFGRCHQTPHNEKVGEWDKDAEDYIIKDEYKNRTAMACDGSGYMAMLITIPEHYCSMWEK